MLLPLLLNNLLTSSAALSISAESGTFNITGTDSTFNRTYINVSDSGTFTLTGVDSSLRFGKSLSADSVNYSLTGQDASVFYGRLINAEATLYSLLSTDSNLLKTYVLGSDSTLYVFDGQSAGLNLKDKIIFVTPIAFNFNGLSANFSKISILETSSGSYVLSPETAALLLNVPSKSYKSYLNNISKETPLIFTINKNSKLKQLV